MGEIDNTFETFFGGVFWLFLEFVVLRVCVCMCFFFFYRNGNSFAE